MLVHLPVLHDKYVGVTPGYNALTCSRMVVFIYDVKRSGDMVMLTANAEVLSIKRKNTPTEDTERDITMVIQI